MRPSFPCHPLLPMQLFLLALALGIFFHDGFYPDAAGDVLPAPGLLLALVLVPKAALAIFYALACRRARRHLGRRGGAALRWLDRAGGLFRYGVLASYGVDLYAGLLRAVRRVIGDLVLLDELCVMALPLLMLLVSWWVYYPIDRRIREASLIGRIDAGLPIYPIWTRGQYLVSQLRHQVALIFAPLLAILAWIEAVAVMPGIGPDAASALTGLGSLGVFLLAPVALRHLWDTAPLPPGEMRDCLLRLCARHNVRVRDLLMWRTFGGLINAAVMGLVAPLRYILLTDALLDMLRREEVEAVMAHELAHVRRRHMFWLMAAAVATLGLLELAANMLLFLLPTEPWSGPPTAAAERVAQWLDEPLIMLGVLIIAGAAVWIAVFGWVSRRVERQADAFAVQSLSNDRPDPQRDATGRVLIDAASVATMVSALGQVARLNHLPTTRKSWRHGSIAWRQAYLRSLVGRPADSLPIDRQMGWIKLTTLGTGAVVVGGYLLLPTAIPVLG